MLFLLFRLGEDRYAIEARIVAEVLPLLDVKQIPLAPAAVRGAFNYRGSAVPLLDLSQLALGRPALPRLSTRIMLVNYPDGRGGTRLLGLLAEHVTDTISRAPAEFQDSGVSLADAPYLGPVTHDEHGLVQWVQIEALLPADVRDLLFQEAEAA